MEASDCFLYFLPEELREFEVCFFHFSRFGRCGGRLLMVVTFLAPGGQRLSSHEATAGRQSGHFWGQPTW